MDEGKLGEAIDLISRLYMDKTRWWNADRVREAIYVVLDAARALQRVKAALDAINNDSDVARWWGRQPITDHIRAAIDGPPVEKEPEDATKVALCKFLKGYRDFCNLGGERSKYAALDLAELCDRLYNELEAK